MAMLIVMLMTQKMEPPSDTDSIPSIGYLEKVTYAVLNVDMIKAYIKA